MPLKCPDCDAMIFTEGLKPGETVECISCGHTYRTKASRSGDSKSAASQPLDSKPCRFCGESIKAVAIKCRYCGSDLTPSAPPPTLDPRELDEAGYFKVSKSNRIAAAEAKKAPVEFHPGVAAVLSFFIPGLGQLYKSQIGQAIVWLIVVPIGYFLFFLPGLLLHLLCIGDAIHSKPLRNT